jgi:hypothetical protein
MKTNNITSNITVDTYHDGLLAAMDYFTQTIGNNEGMRTNKIGYDLQYIGGVRRERVTYENYIDSGSNEYFYFEVVTEEEAN